jgi:uncharacterized protein YciI
MSRILTGLLLAAISLGAQPSELYYMAFLRPAPDRKPLPQAEMERIQTAHMANIRSMAARGVLVAAGPFGDTPPTISGVFVFRTGSLEEARRIASEDPTVVEHRNTVDVLAWRGPKGIGEEYVQLHKMDPKTPEDMGIQPFFLLRRGNGVKAAALNEHDGYLAELRRQGKIAAAGAVEGDADVASVVIFRRMAEAEARGLIDADPAVKSGALRPEFHNWWCAAHVLPG